MSEKTILLKLMEELEQKNDRGKSNVLIIRSKEELGKKRSKLGNKESIPFPNRPPWIRGSLKGIR